MTVTDFKAKEQPESKVWVCDCGNESFWLYEDGRIECMDCNAFHTTMTGYWKLFDPEGPITMRPGDEGTSQGSKGDARVQDGQPAQRLKEGTGRQKP